MFPQTPIIIIETKYEGSCVIIITDISMNAIKTSLRRSIWIQLIWFCGLTILFFYLALTNELS